MKKYEFFNRELSWLSFNYRVLQEAKNPAVPLMERIKFLAIYSSNLDEFFRVRVASLRSLIELKNKGIDKRELDPKLLLKKIYKIVDKQQEEFGGIYRNEILPELEKNDIYLIDGSKLNDLHKAFLNEYFELNLKPVLIPIIISDKHTLPFLQNKSVYFAVKLSSRKDKNLKAKEYQYAILEIPAGHLSRFVVLPRIENINYVMFLDDIVKYFLPEIFDKYKVEESYSVKLTRDAELYIDDEFSGDMLLKIKKSLARRKTGVPSRFLYDSKMPKRFLKDLQEILQLKKDESVRGGKYHNFNDFFSFPDFGKKNLSYKPMPPLISRVLESDNDIFKLIAKQDIALHFPYQNYNYVVKFLNKAATDKNVKSIKITLYRVADNSAIANELIIAAKNGKKVTAFVEVKARFDEEANFFWADELKKNGVRVLYSFPGLKVHAKICLIERFEKSDLNYYAYLATGNFNEKTSRIYADHGLFTFNKNITADLKKIFKILERKSEKEKFNSVFVAPFNLRESFSNLVQTEIDNVKNGREGKIILKLNSLEDKKMIKLLYKASKAGVKINIIVRGICCLVPGMNGFSKNIYAVSIVDRFLEHSRVYIFYNNGNEKIFLSSADWMSRNLNRRIEICFPVTDKKIKKELRDIINIQLNDNTKARIIDEKQSNRFVERTSNQIIRAQYEIYDYLKHKNEV